MLLACTVCSAQEKRGERSNKVIVDGLVNKSTTYSYADAARFRPVSTDSIQIFNHQMKYRKTIHHIEGILLKDLISEAGINMENAKLLSELYFTCTATDGYMVTFSWNELFNTEVGNKVMLITRENGKEARELEEGITLISAADAATGRRYVYNIAKITINRAK
jgi:hypothetical protein